MQLHITEEHKMTPVEIQAYFLKFTPTFDSVFFLKLLYLLSLIIIIVMFAISFIRSSKTQKLRYLRHTISYKFINWIFLNFLAILYINSYESPQEFPKHEIARSPFFQALNDEQKEYVNFYLNNDCCAKSKEMITIGEATDLISKAYNNRYDPDYKNKLDKTN